MLLPRAQPQTRWQLKGHAVSGAQALEPDKRKKKSVIAFLSFSFFLSVIHSFILSLFVAPNAGMQVVQKVWLQSSSFGSRSGVDPNGCRQISHSMGECTLFCDATAASDSGATLGGKPG